MPLRQLLSGHSVSTAYEMGWSELANGDLLDAAEADFDALATTDQNLRYQQDLAGRRLAIIVLPTTSWPRILAHEEQVVAAINALRPAEIVELNFS